MKLEIEWRDCFKQNEQNLISFAVLCLYFSSIVYLSYSVYGL